MNGIQFFLKEDVPLAHGHTIYLDSPWALTSISQQQFWADYDLADYGDGEVKGVISVDISNWHEPGNTVEKPAKYCTSDEIKTEVWEELKRSHARDEQPLTDEMLHCWFLDPDITRDQSLARMQESDRSVPRLDVPSRRTEPLFVAYLQHMAAPPPGVHQVSQPLPGLRPYAPSLVATMECNAQGGEAGGQRDHPEQCAGVAVPTVESPSRVLVRIPSRGQYRYERGLPGRARRCWHAHQGGGQGWAHHDHGAAGSDPVLDVANCGCDADRRNIVPQPLEQAQGMGESAHLSPVDQRKARSTPLERHVNPCAAAGSGPFLEGPRMVSTLFLSRPMAAAPRRPMGNT
jgi:hypothetical protein